MKNLFLMLVLVLIYFQNIVGQEIFIPDRVIIDGKVIDHSEYSVEIESPKIVFIKGVGKRSLLEIRKEIEKLTTTKTKETIECRLYDVIIFREEGAVFRIEVKGGGTTNLVLEKFKEVS